MKEFSQCGRLTIPFAKVIYVAEERTYGNVTVYLQDNRSVIIECTDGASRFLREYKEWLEGGGK